MVYFKVNLSPSEWRDMRDVIQSDEAVWIRDNRQPDTYYGSTSEYALKLLTDSLSPMAFSTFQPVSENEFQSIRDARV